jgi:hypothetical protein
MTMWGRWPDRGEPGVLPCVGAKRPRRDRVEVRYYLAVSGLLDTAGSPDAGVVR